MLALHPEKCSNDATTGCPHKRWHMTNRFKAKLPQAVRNGLVGTPLDITNPTAYFAKADELMASVRSKQMAKEAVNEVKDAAGEVDAVGNRGGGKASGNKKQTTKPNICDNHKRFKKDTWKCLKPTFTNHGIYHFVT